MIAVQPVDVSDLIAQPGAVRRVTLREPIEGMATGMARVPEEAPVGVDVLLESTAEGIVVSGPLSGRIAYRCARCLTAFDRDFRMEVEELFAYEPDEEEDEYPIDHGRIDLEQMVRDNVVLAMPFSPLCREDCLGLCERCGGDRNLGECGCGPEVDPRWSVLDRLDLED